MQPRQFVEEKPTIRAGGSAAVGAVVNVEVVMVRLVYIKKYRLLHIVCSFGRL